MKIVQLLDSKSVGGIETHVHILSHNLIKNKQVVSVIFLKDYGIHPIESKFQRDNIPYHKLNGGIFSLISYLKKECIDVLHTHGYKAGIMGKILGVFLRIKVISTYHSGDQGKGKLRLYTFLDNLLSPLCLPLAVSHEISKLLYRKPQVIKNFVEIPSCVNHKKKCNSIGFVGRLSLEKGPDIYIEVARFFPEIKFHIFGDGVMMDDLNGVAPSNCIFHGHIDDVGKAWKEIDMLCMPSRFEGLPMAALEAMGNGIPVLASNVGAFPDLIDNYQNGLIAEMGNVHDFKDKIRRWLSSSSQFKSDVSKKAYNTIQKKFNADHEIRNMISVYQFLNEGHSYKKLKI